MKRNFQEEIIKYKNKYIEVVNKDKWRANYHIMAPIGWINDPNGLCYFSGKYHVYFQYSPLDSNGGLKFWGHYTSRDLVKWNEEEIALYPDSKFDRDGVYSGSALVKDNKIHFFYTGNVKFKGEHDYILSGREQNVILVTSKDGINFSEKKRILSNKDFPSNMSLHVRDPKVWEEDGIYYMVLGARGKDNKGYLLIYKSKDLYNWELDCDPIGGNEDLGYMWECPDIIKINNNEILLFSPQGIKAQEYKFNNIYQSGYIVKKQKCNEKKICLDNFIEFDNGFDFYAPQSFRDKNGRIIMFGWMGIPDEPEHKNPTIKNYWQHQLTIPRELILKNNVLIQVPVKELEKLRKNLIEIQLLDISNKISLEIFHSYSFELNVNFNNTNEFLIEIREDCKLSFMNKVFKLELGQSGFGRKKRLVEIDFINNIRIFSDNSSLEVFINNGLNVFSTRIYNNNFDNLFKIQGNGKVYIQKWNI
ncbi:sucrose-6-phosphate hydrolase [Clostridium carnis]